METWEAIRSRRNVRSYADRPIADDRLCAWLIALGYPADRPLRPIRRPNRRPFDEVVHRDRW